MESQVHHQSLEQACLRVRGHLALIELAAYELFVSRPALSLERVLKTWRAFKEDETCIEGLSLSESSKNQWLDIQARAYIVMGLILRYTSPINLHGACEFSKLYQEELLRESARAQKNSLSESSRAPQQDDSVGEGPSEFYCFYEKKPLSERTAYLWLCDPNFNVRDERSLGTPLMLSDQEVQDILSWKPSDLAYQTVIGRFKNMASPPKNIDFPHEKIPRHPINLDENFFVNDRPKVERGEIPIVVRTSDPEESFLSAERRWKMTHASHSNRSSMSQEAAESDEEPGAKVQLSDLKRSQHSQETDHLGSTVSSSAAQCSEESNAEPGRSSMSQEAAKSDKEPGAKAQLSDSDACSDQPKMNEQPSQHGPQSFAWKPYAGFISLGLVVGGLSAALARRIFSTSLAASCGLGALITLLITGFCSILWRYGSSKKSFDEGEHSIGYRPSPSAYETS